MINLKNWDVLRVIRLIAGALVLWSAFIDRQPLLGLLGGMLLLQAALRVGCGSAGCGIPSRSYRSIDSKPEDTVNQVTYEEVK